MSKCEPCFAAFTFVVIEDDAVFRHQLVQFLQQRGAIVAQADNGADGLKLINDVLPDLVLCDLGMPVMDGQQVIKAILGLQQQVPIIVISAAANMEAITEALENGASDYFIKPLQHWVSLEQTILLELKPRKTVFEQHSYALGVEQELTSHMAYFRRDDQAATLLIKELNCNSRFIHDYLQFVVTGESVCMMLVYFELSEHELSLFVAGVDPLEPDAAVSLAILKSLLNDNYRHYHKHQQYRLTSPSQMLSYLNRQYQAMTLKYPLSLMQMQLNTATRRIIYSNAGIKARASNLTEGDLHCDLSLGLLPDYPYEQHELTMTLPLTLAFQTAAANRATDGITLTISDSEAIII
ncbi:response regulator [Motilimonas eburnea]|uniref:response regulator n=1 Tax=Motilimonas eburnea TaxID=1737488 RepID=UPI001E2DD1E2|nr:response regulator [Motilimonas eburnea]MCE2571476.1 response regulator [Motilimonas eburnea]